MGKKKNKNKNQTNQSNQSQVVTQKDLFLMDGQSNKINMDYHTWDTTDNLIEKYRQASLFPEMQYAMEEIKNTVFVYENGELPFHFRLKNNDDIKDGLRKQFADLTEKFYLESQDLINYAGKFFDRYYIDGRLYIRKMRKDDTSDVFLYVIIDPKSITKKYDTKNKVFYWVIKPSKNNDPCVYQYATNQDDVIVPFDDVIYIDSGKELNNTVVSHIHQALRPLNQLNLLKDHLLIYRIVRSPERLVFYVDTGNLPPNKSEAQVESLKEKYNYKSIFNHEDGTYSAVNSKHSMLDNIWLSRNNNRSTEVSSIGGNININGIEDYKMIQIELYKMLHIPLSKLEIDNGGRTITSSSSDVETNSDENNLRKFTNMLRFRYSPIYVIFLIDFLKENGMTDSDIDLITSSIFLEWEETNNYKMSYKFADHRVRMELVQEMMEFTYLPNNEDNVDKIPLYSIDYIYRNIMGYSENDIVELKKQIKKEMSEKPLYTIEEPIE